MNRYIVLVLALLIPFSNLISMEKQEERKPNIINIATTDAKIVCAIPTSYALASPFLKDFYDEFGVLTISDEQMDHFNLIKDYLEHEYNIKNKLESPGAVNVLLLKKSDQELAHILNAAQIFQLNNVSKSIASILAMKLSRPERQEECLKTGTFGLDLTSDAANLVAQEMCTNKSLKNFYRFHEIITKYHTISFKQLPYPSAPFDNLTVKSPDGSIHCNIYLDGDIHLFDAKGYPISVLKGHASCVTATCFSSDSSMLATGSFDNNIRIWNVKTHQQINALQSNMRCIESMCFNNDGSILAACGLGTTTLQFWDIKTGKLFYAVESPVFMHHISFNLDDCSLLILNHIHNICYVCDIPQSSCKYFFDYQLTPERVLLLDYYQHYFEDEHLYDKYPGLQEERNNINKYPGLEIIKKTLPKELRELLPQTFWGITLNLPTKAAILTAGVAATSWTAKKLYAMLKKKK